MRVTQQIDALDIMGVNSASYLILPKNSRTYDNDSVAHVTLFFCRVIGAFCTAWFARVSLMLPIWNIVQYSFVEWYVWCSFIKSLVFAFIIASVSTLRIQKEDLSQWERLVPILSYAVVY